MERDNTLETGTVKDINNDPDVLLKQCKRAVIQAYNVAVSNLQAYVVLEEKDVYIVWFSKTLQNFKALLSTDLHDGKYYEVTYNGDRGQFYVDTYKKLFNTEINLEHLQ